MSEHSPSLRSSDRSTSSEPSIEAEPTSRPPALTSAVLLDFHNTLAVVRSMDSWVDEARAHLGRGPEPHTVPLERIRNVWADAKIGFPASDWDLDPAAHRHAFITTLSHDGAIRPDFAEALYAVMPDQWELNAGAADFISRASAAGMRMAVVSNIALDIRPALESWGIASALDAVILSFEVGFVKPDPRIFQLAADSLGTDPMECLMIGDSPDDDTGGAALGIQTLISRPDRMWRAFALAVPR